MSKYVIIGGLVVLLMPCHAAADNAAPPSPGSLVRVTAPSIAKVPLIATLVDSSATELTVFRPETGKASIPRDAITRLEWSSGRRPQIVKGALWGAGVLSVLGFIGSGGDSCDSSCQVAGVAGSAALGAGFGALIGLAFKTYDWKDTPVAHVQVSFQPVRGGGRAAVAFSW